MMKINHAINKFSAAFVLWLILTIAAGATTIARMDLRDLAHSAQAIVRARCEGSQPLWDAGSIWSDYEFTVLETLKGAPPKSVMVRLPGGRIGHLETKVDGIPKFRAGEEVVLFIEQTSGGGTSITSWAQGTFRVRHNAAGESRLSQDTSRFAVFDPATRTFTTAGIRDILLVDFRKQLAEALRADGSRR
jgi:hypothetical protein